MKKNLMLIIKGFVFGIANIIPGVSGGTIALTLGVYEDFIYAISHLFKEFKNSLKFLLPFGIGAASAILLMSKAINYALIHHPFATTLLFIGLIIGGIPFLTRNVKNNKIKPSYILLFLLSFIIVIAMSFGNTNVKEVTLTNPNILTYITLLIVGVVAAATMVIPGISGSFVLVLLGYYGPIVNTISNLTKLENLTTNISILLVFGIGVLLGIILVSKLIEYLFNKHKVKTYYAILGFILASIITLAATLTGVYMSTKEIIIGLILLIIGFIAGYKLGDE